MVDAVIAGAGIAGIATAWQLAERLGRTDLVLVDPHGPLTLTSNRPEANYRDWWPQPPMAELADLSLRLVQELQATGAGIPMDRRGYLYVTADPVRAAGLGDVVASRASLPGGGAAALDQAEIRSAWPHLSPALLGGIRVERAGGIDTVALGRAMLERAIARGATILRGAVADVRRTGGRVASVGVEGGGGTVRLGTHQFVNAAGPFARTIARGLEVEMPFETVLRQKLVIRDRSGVVPRGAPFTILLDGLTLDWPAADRRSLDRTDDGHRLLGPLPGGIHVKPDDTAGPDAIKLGWAWDQRPLEPAELATCPPEFPRMVLLGSSVAVPGLRRYLDDAPLAHDGGFYARTPDGRPLIGPMGPQGSFVVGAMAGFGAMMAAGSGFLAARWLLGDEPTSLMQAFDPARFASPEYRQDLAEGRIATGEL